MTLFTKIAYLTLALLLIAQPHIIKGHVFSIPNPFAQSLATLLIGAVAIAIYMLHLRDMERTNLEKQKIERALDVSSGNLSEAYRYIGQLNQRVPLLASLTTKLISLPRQGKKATKAIIDNLLTTAVVTLAKSRWGFFRFIETESAKTIKEYYYITGPYLMSQARIGNKALLNLSEEERYHVINDAYVVTTSDQSASVRCIFVFAKPEHEEAVKTDRALIQAIVDQAQLFYKYLH